MNMHNSRRALRSGLIIGVACVATAASTATLAATPAAKAGADEDRIAFSRYDPKLDGNALWTIRPDGTGERRVTNGQANIPSWSPDRSRILFSFPDNAGHEQLADIGADGRGFRQLTHMPGVSDSAEYTPDGKRIVFNHSPLMPDDPAFFTSTWLMNADGSHPRPLFEPDPAKFDVEPGVSPDGRRVVFNRLGVIDGEQAGSVFVVNINGTHERQVTPETVGLEHPQWSPDGRRIVYEIDNLSDVPHPTDGIWTSTLQGDTNLVLRSTDDVLYLQPKYNRRGDRIVVTCVDLKPVQTDLCVLHANGEGVHNITNTHSEFESWPDW